MEEKLQQELIKIRSLLQQDGGDIELVSVDEANGIVKVKLQGACGSCPMSQMTLKNVVEQKLKESISEIKEVVSV